MTDTPTPEEPSKPEDPVEAGVPTTEGATTPVDADASGDLWTEHASNAPSAAPAGKDSDLKYIDIPILVAIVALFLSLLVAPLTPYDFLGLPSHVIIVHAAVVFIPLLAIAAVIALWVEKWRARFSGWLAGAGIVVFAITTAAVKSGEKLRDHLFGADLKRFAAPNGGVAGNGTFPPLGAGSRTGGFRAARRGNAENALIHRHADWAGKLHWIVLALAIVLIGHFIIRRVKVTNTAPVTLVFKIAGTVAAVATLVCVAYVGHLGAEATWHDRVGTGNANSGQTNSFFGNGGGGGGFFGGTGAGPGGSSSGTGTPGNNFQNRLRQYRSQTDTSGQTSPQSSSALSQTNAGI